MQALTALLALIGVFGVFRLQSGRSTEDRLSDGAVEPARVLERELLVLRLAPPLVVEFVVSDGMRYVYDRRNAVTAVNNIVQSTRRLPSTRKRHVARAAQALQHLAGRYGELLEDRARVRSILKEVMTMNALGGISALVMLMLAHCQSAHGIILQGTIAAIGGLCVVATVLKCTDMLR